MNAAVAGRVRIRSRDPRQCLKIDEVASLMGVTVRTIKRWVRKGTFPRPIKPTESLALWLWGDVDAWLTEQKERTQ